jgi:hypothetical protein
MTKPAISREDVHSYSESCSDLGIDFQSIAARLVKSQTRLKTFIEQNFSDIDPMAGQVALYMFSVSLRVFEQAGGRLKKVNSGDLKSAQRRVNEVVESLLPLDTDFPVRAKAIQWRAQENLLDEILWALFDRVEEEKKDEETVLDKKQSALIYIMLWTAIEALDGKYRP